ncbi:hypothetical protein [Rossellomorea marisflavi]|uniref:hypothetical protein n=1 Tax=Rossellomorea marisflavi TaxID=189381 RepID=UPI0009A8EF68|nr:hypothetical protein [Rossellomorea marisflavi]
MTKISTKDWRNLPIEKWNTTTFHTYLTDLNREKFDVTYEPFGKGSVAKRWSTEKGQLKNALNKYGNEVIREYIDKCFASHSFNPEFPTLSFGFMFSYMRKELSQAEVSVSKRKIREEYAKQNENTEVDDEWF